MGRLRNSDVDYVQDDVVFIFLAFLKYKINQASNLNLENTWYRLPEEDSILGCPQQLATTTMKVVERKEPTALA